VTGHWLGCATSRTHVWQDRLYCADCGIWLSPPTAHVFARLGLQNNGTGSACDARPAPSARPLGGPTDER
jgi:hypothetical protein